MGTFRSLYTQLPCERCGRVRRVEIQFKTGEAIGSDRQEEYDVGDRVYDLEPGSVFEGCAERFCFRCSHDYYLADNEARHCVLAGFVEDGRLTIADRCNGRGMTAGEILGRGAFQAALLRRAALDRLPAGSGRWSIGSDGWPAQSHDLVWDGEALDRERFTSRAQFRFLGENLAAVDAWMLEHGWRDGADWLREDLSVRVDERGIIGFTMPEG